MVYAIAILAVSIIVAALIVARAVCRVADVLSLYGLSAALAWREYREEEARRAALDMIVKTKNTTLQ